MAFFTGSSGQLLLRGADGQFTSLAKVSRWSYSGSMATLETTTLGDTDRTIVAGTRSHTGSATLFYYQDENNGNANSCATLISNLIHQRIAEANDGVAAESPELRMRLKVLDGTANGKFIEGDVFLTGASMSMAVGEVLSAEVSFEFNGAPTAVVL